MYSMSSRSFPTVCPTGLEETVLVAGSTDFVVVGEGNFGASDPLSPPTIDVNDAVRGSGGSITITADDQIIVKPLCPDAFILSATVTVTGATSVTILYLDGSGTEVDSYMVSLRNENEKMFRVTCKYA